jgi:hypothetical protein
VLCKTQAALSEAWSLATGRFSAATKALTGDRVDKMSEEDYRALLANAEEARLASENARLLLELHRAEHGC